MNSGNNRSMDSADDWCANGCYNRCGGDSADNRRADSCDDRSMDRADDGSAHCSDDRGMDGSRNNSRRVVRGDGCVVGGDSRCVEGGHCRSDSNGRSVEGRDAGGVGCILVDGRWGKVSGEVSVLVVEDVGVVYGSGEAIRADDAESLVAETEGLLVVESTPEGEGVGVEGREGGEGVALGLARGVLTEGLASLGTRGLILLLRGLVVVLLLV